jgi:RHS repeat-associated protein
MVAMHNGTSLVYFAQDHLSSTSLVIDDEGGLLSQNRYKPFGEIRTDIASSPITQTDFGYTGQRNLGDMGVMDYDARFYSPTLGRFLQPDTIMQDMGNPQSWNRYSYVKNNPILYNDPSGHFWNIVAGVVIGAAVGAVVEAASQVIEQWDSEKSIGENIKSTEWDSDKIIVSAVGGAVFGGLTAVGATAAAKIAAEGTKAAIGFAATTSGLYGALGGCAAGQAESLTAGALSQKRTTGSYKGSFEAAKERGFLNAYKMTGDAAAGFIIGWSGFHIDRYIKGTFKPESKYQSYNSPRTIRGINQSNLSLAAQNAWRAFSRDPIIRLMVNLGYQMADEFKNRKVFDVVDDFAIPQ